MALAGLLRQLGSADRELGLQAPVAVSDAHEVRWRLEESGRQWSDPLGLSPHCLKGEGAPRVMASLGGDAGATGAMQLACCSSCHVGKNTVQEISEAGRLNVKNACKACHQEFD
jgi:hypothetical protein